MPLPRISVIVPSFNRCDLLPETLDAILAQTHSPAEVILVDDGSTDATAAMLAARYAGRITYRRIENSGDLAARNIGLAMACGELVAFCDSDDVWHPEFLAAMAGLWRREPGLRVAFSDFDIIRDRHWQGGSKFAAAPAAFWSGLRPLGPQGAAAFDVPIVERLLRFQPFFPSCMVADRQALVQLGGWDTSVGRIVGTDFATALLLAEHPPFGVLRRALVGIRKHAGNYSADVQAMNLGDAAILAHVLARRPSLAPHATAIRASIAERRAQALDLAFARQDFAAVRASFVLLPPAGRRLSARVKHAVAGLPAPLRRVLSGVLLRAGSWRARPFRTVAARYAGSDRAQNPPSA